METSYRSIVFMGKITSGKGTQAALVARELNCDIFSVGEQVRAAANRHTAFGKKIKEAYETGLLMPEWIAEYWMMDALFSKYSGETLVFEAVAKKPSEAALFHEIHEWLGRTYVVFNLEVPDSVVKERTKKRERDAVDAFDIMEKRLSEYKAHTTKSLEVFRSLGTCVDIDGTKSIDDVSAAIFNVLNAK